MAQVVLGFALLGVYLCSAPDCAIDRVGALTKQNETADASPANDEWSRYVSEFLAEHELTAEEQALARSALARALYDRERYFRRVSGRVDALRVTIAEARTDDERREARLELARVERGDEYMFDALKLRLVDMTRDPRAQVGFWPTA